MSVDGVDEVRKMEARVASLQRQLNDAEKDLAAERLRVQKQRKRRDPDVMKMKSSLSLAFKVKSVFDDGMGLDMILQRLWFEHQVITQALANIFPLRDQCSLHHEGWCLLGDSGKCDWCNWQGRNVCHLRWKGLAHPDLLIKWLKRRRSDWWKRVINEFDDSEVSVVLGSSEEWFWGFGNSPTTSPMTTALQPLLSALNIQLEVIPDTLMDFETWGRIIEHQDQHSSSADSPRPFDSCSGEIDPKEMKRLLQPSWWKMTERTSSNFFNL